MQQNHSEEAFLPAFCSPVAVFIVVLVGELLAAFIALSHSQLPDFNWSLMGSASLFIQWVGLVSAGVLCGLRPTVKFWTLRQQLVFVYFVVLSVTAVCSMLANYLMPDGAPWWRLIKAVLLSAIVVGIGLRYFVLQHLHQQQKQAQLQSQIEVLQARIQPHFMFNTLNAIASVIHVDQDKAEAMTLDFADLMRSTMQQPALVPLASEIDLCKQYSSLEQIRFGEKLTFNWSVSAASEAIKVPNLLLQPLIENAIYHGIQGRPEGGLIEISSTVTANELVISVRNPLAGQDFSPQSGQRFALDNITHRLQLIYGDSASMKQQLSDSYFEVNLNLPLGDA